MTGRSWRILAAALLIFGLIMLRYLGSQQVDDSTPLPARPLMKHVAVLQCLHDPVLAISRLEDIVRQVQMCGHEDSEIFATAFNSLYVVTGTRGRVMLPDTFRPKVLKWLGNNAELVKEVEFQTIVNVYNKVTHEAAVLNPLRAKRPGAGAPAAGSEEYVDKLVANTAADCDFCHYEQNTAVDPFGRIIHEHAMTAANTFKYDAAHGLVMFRHHHPLKWTRPQFLDLMSTVNEWFAKAHMASPNLLYPHFMWDILPRASASQIHPHIQASLSGDRYYGAAEHLRRAAAGYRMQHGFDYFDQVMQVHHSLGLTVKLGSATAMAYLTARKDWEVMIIAPTANEDFALLLHYCLRAYIDEFKLYALSIAAYYPAFKGAPSLPAIVRFVDRGAVDSARSDISAMELFGQANVNMDPFAVATRLRAAVTTAMAADNVQH